MVTTYGVDIDRSSCFPRLTPTAQPGIPSTSSPRLSVYRSAAAAPSPSVWVFELEAREPSGAAVISAPDTMPGAAANSSGKSFLQRASDKVLRWLRRSLRTSHQVIPLAVNRSYSQCLSHAHTTISPLGVPVYLDYVEPSCVFQMQLHRSTTVTFVLPLVSRSRNVRPGSTVYSSVF